MTGGGGGPPLFIRGGAGGGPGGGRAPRGGGRAGGARDHRPATTNTPAAHQKMSVKRASVPRAKSERGWSVAWGNGPPHPEMASAAVASQSRMRGTATGFLT